MALASIFWKIIDFFLDNPGLFFRFRRLVVNDFACEKEIILAESAPNKAKYVLDFGCGVGQYSTLFNPRFYVGVDIESKYIDYARRNFKGEFFLIRKGEPLALRQGTFDLILAIDIFHHLTNEDSHALLEEFKRVLKRSGKVIVVDIFPRKLQPKLLARLLVVLDRGRFARGKDEFVRLFSELFSIAKYYTTESGPYIRQVFVLAARS